MPDAVLSSPFLGLALSAAAWCAGLWAQKRTGFILCSPLVVASVLIILVLAFFRIPLESYQIGGSLIQLLLAPATTVLALNIYRQRKALKEYFFPILAGCLAGSLTSLVSVLLLCRLFGLDGALTDSLLPKSVTSAIALGISEGRGGIPSITAAAVVLTGLTGAVFAPLLGKLFRITDPVAEGLAIGASSHALGTTKALELGELQGAMSSIAICVCGILTSVLVLFF